MTISTVITMLGGLGLFLLGVHHITEGLKGLAGDSLRRGLQKLASGRFSSIASGALFTAVIQSSTAAIFMVIGFVSAGLVTFSQAIGIIMGATLGTTSTPWLLAVFGFRVRIASFALPMLGVGALMWLVGKGRTRSAGAVLAGFGLLFNGIEYMQTGMKGVSWHLEAFTGPGALWILAAIGMVMTVVMQSSTAAAATTLVALNAGSLTFDQSCAMIVGQSMGTTAKTALMLVGGGLAVRRAVLAHILYTLGAGVLGMVFLRPLVMAAEWVGSRLHDPEGVLALAAFSTIFKVAGIAAFLPWIDPLARLIVRLSGTGSQSAVARLEPAVAEAGGSIALEAAWRAILEIARGVVDVVRRRLGGESVKFEPPVEAVQQTERFLESLSLETTDLSTFAPRLVKLVHALDHVGELQDDLTRIPRVNGGPPAVSLEAGAHALEAWLDAEKEPDAVPDPSIFTAIENASKQLTTECKAGREKLLEDIALQRTPAAAARADLDTLAWADLALYHSWHLAESLRVASAK